MMHEHVVVGQHGEDVRVLRDGRFRWDERGVLQVAEVEIGNGRKAGQVERAGYAVHRPPVDAQFGHQPLEHVAGDGFLHLEPDGGLEPVPLQFPFQRLQQVLGDVFVDLQVADAGDPEGMVFQHVKTDEQLVEMSRDHVLERDEALRRDGQEPGQQRRHLHPGEHRLAGFRVGHHDREAERQAGDVRERVGRVHHEGGEHRIDPLAEQLVQAALLGGRQLLPAQDLDPLGGQVGLDRIDVAGGMPQGQLARDLEHVLQYLGRPAAGMALDGKPGGHPADQPGHAHHEELVQVAGEDGCEPDPFQQRHRRILGQFEHPLVEPEPTLLALEIPLLGQLRPLGPRLFRLRHGGRGR